MTTPRDPTIDDVRLERERLRARCAVLMQGLAAISREHPALMENIAVIVAHADIAAENVRLSDCVVATVSSER